MIDTTPYAELSPDALLDAVEAAGWRCDGSLLALNSYENRVYQIGQEEGTPIVGKFYRPERWSDAQILEEHAFTAELLEHEMSVVAPLLDDAGATLFHQGGFRFSLFPRQGGFHQIDEPTTSVESDTIEEPTDQSEKEISTWEDYFK